MIRLPRYSYVLAFTFCYALFPPATDCQTRTANRTVKNSVSGRITVHGKAAPGVIVGIRSQDDLGQPLPTFRATADQDGDYRITGIPAGNYHVFPMAPAYVNPDLDAFRGRGKTLLLGEGEDVQAIDFSLVRGGVITGKVTNADDRPVMEERIIIMTADQPKEQQRMPISMNGSQTDDRGVYRIYGIPAGRYKVSVGRADDDVYSNRGRIAYKRTFYGDTSEPSDAKVVEVTEGSESGNIDISLGRSLPAFAASGRIVDSATGQPVRGLRIGLRRILLKNSAIMNLLTVSNSNGEFHLENVTPGKYSIVHLPEPGGEVNVDAEPFEVIDQDVTGLVVKTTSGLSITGTLMLEGVSDKVVLAKLGELRLSIYVQSETPTWGIGWDSLVSADGSFHIGGLTPGTANFYLQTLDGREVTMFSISRVEQDGIVQPRGIEIKTGEHVTGVKIIVSYGSGSVRGEVKLVNSNLLQGRRVVVWLKRLGDTGSNFRSYEMDARGHFLIKGVAAGSYELNVNVNGPERLLPSVKQLISVSEGTATVVDLTLDLKSDSRQLQQP
jgi:hypothetical protein